MALGDVIARLSVLLGMDTAAFEKGADIGEKRLAQLQRKMTSVGRKMQRVGAQMTAGITAPLLGVAAASIKVGTEFEKSMTNVATLVDTTTEDMGKMEDAVLDIAKRVPVPLGDLTAALYQVRSAGVGASDALGVLEQSARLGVAGLGTTEESVNIVTSALNAFGLQGKEAADIYDNIFRTVKAGKTTISELGQSFGAVAPVVAQAGVKVDEFLAATAALTTTGLPASQSQTQLRAAIAGLTRDTKESAAAFKELGAKNFPDLVQKSGGLVQAFTKLREVTGGNDAKLLKLVGSIEAYNAIVGLTGTANKAFTDTLAGMRAGITLVDEAFLKQAGTTAAQWQTTINSLTVSAIKISKALAPVIAVLADFLADVADAFSELSPTTQKWVIAIAATAAALGPLLIALGALLKIAAGVKTLTLFASGLTGIGLASGTAATGATAVGIAVRGLLGPIGLAITAVTAAYYAWKHWDKIKPIVMKMVAGVTSALKMLASPFNWVADKLTWIGKLFFQLYDKVVGHSYIPDMVDGIAKHMARLDQEMVEVARKATTKTGEAFLDLANRLRGVLDRLYPQAAEANAFASDLKTIQDALKATEINADQAADAIGRLWRERITGSSTGTVAPGLQDPGSLVGDLDPKKITEALKGVLAPLEKVKEKMTDLKRAAGDAFAELGHQLKGVLFQAQSLGDALKNLAARLADMAFNMAWNSLGSALKIPGFASGTNFAPGGLALVGERGPELVDLPRGSRVYTAQQTQGMMSGGRGGVTMNVYTPNADSFRRSERQISRELGRKVG